ncbi:hypothetical protein DSN97_04220 [Deferribacteraceae bacterium V6Fe1]|nr:hypothetical protein DSN97_04220 [Deferribacteraceae bacterium V6Fe1]
MDLKNIIENFDNLKETDKGLVYFNSAKKLILQEIERKNFNVYSIIFAALILKNKIKLEKSPVESQLRKSLIKEFGNIKDVEISSHPLKLNLALIIFVTDVLQGNFKNSKVDLLERIVEVNANNFVLNNNQVAPFFQILKSIYTLDEVVEILKNNIFKGKFWNKSLFSKKTAFLWVFPIFWSCFGFERQFKSLYEPWLSLFYKAIQKKDTELVFFMMLPMTHIYTNLSTTQEEYRQFNKEVNIPFANYVQEHVVNEYSITPCTKNVKNEDESKKIAYVYDRIVGSSPVKLLYSLLENLTQQDNKNEYYVYDLEIIEKTPSDKRFVEMIKSLGVKYFSAHSTVKDIEYGVHYYSHIEKALKLREKIIEDDIDVLIMGNNWSYPIFLYGTRTAPKQIYWCHGAFEFDVPGIDKRITHIPEGSPMHQNDIPFERFQLRQSDIFFQEEVEENKKKAAEIRKKFPEDVIILGSIGRLIKLEGEGYLEAVAEIMKQNPDTIYLACGTGGTENIKKKIKELGIADRFYFEGWVDPAIYAHVIDVYLNTFPDPSGEALVEYKKYRADGQSVSLYENSNNIEAYLNLADFFFGLRYLENKDIFCVREKYRNKIYDLVGGRALIITFDFFGKNKQEKLQIKLQENNDFIFVTNNGTNDIFYKNKKFTFNINPFFFYLSSDVLFLNCWDESILKYNIDNSFSRIYLLNDENMNQKISVEKWYVELSEKISIVRNNRISHIELFNFIFKDLRDDLKSNYFKFKGKYYDLIQYELSLFLDSFIFKNFIDIQSRVIDIYKELSSRI